MQDNYRNLDLYIINWLSINNKFLNQYNYIITDMLTVYNATYTNTKQGTP